MMWSSNLLALIGAFILPIQLVSAQFGGGIFEQMFGGGGQPFGGHQHQHQTRSPNVGSDSTWYRQNFENAQCDKYLCPATLSCVDRPSHCPCAWPAQEDKVELGDELAICGSKGGWKTGEFARKVELARKGLL